MSVPSTATYWSRLRGVAHSTFTKCWSGLKTGISWHEHKKAFKWAFSIVWQHELYWHLTRAQTTMCLPSAVSTLSSFLGINDRRGQRRRNWTRHQSKPAGLQEGHPYLRLWQECIKSALVRVNYCARINYQCRRTLCVFEE